MLMLKLKPAEALQSAARLVIGSLFSQEIHRVILFVARESIAQLKAIK